MIISVVIPTYNREQYIASAIHSVIEQTLNADEYEIIVVDNASTDNTKKIVQEIRKSRNNLKYVFEAKQGLNFARNTGLSISQGKYVAFLDDDAIACRDWLERIVSVFERNLNIGVCGGKVNPIWEIPKPVWVTPSMEKPLTVLDIADEATILKLGDYLVGANFAFSRDVLVSIGGFKEGLDRIGNKLLSNGDVQVVRKIQNTGYLAYYDPDISVKHVVPQNRLTKKWFMKRYYWQGYSDAYQIGGVTLSKFINLFLSSAKSIILIMVTSSEFRFERFLIILYNWGYIQGLFRA